MEDILKKIPRKNKHVYIHDIEGQKILFDSVSGSIAKISKEAIKILKLCNGYLSIKEIYNILKLEYSDLVVEDIFAYLKELERGKFIKLFSKEKSKKPKILLIQPPFPFEHSRYQTSYYAPPLGLLYIASELESVGYTVDILDMAVLNLRSAKIISYMEEEVQKPDLIGISANMTFTYSNVSRIAQNIKDLYPEIPIVLGGNHATFCYEEILTSESAKMGYYWPM